MVPGMLAPSGLPTSVKMPNYQLEMQFGVVDIINITWCKLQRRQHGGFPDFNLTTVVHLCNTEAISLLYVDMHLSASINECTETIRDFN